MGELKEQEGQAMILQQAVTRKLHSSSQKGNPRLMRSPSPSSSAAARSLVRSFVISYPQVNARKTASPPPLPPLPHPFLFFPSRAPRRPRSLAASSTVCPTLKFRAAEQNLQRVRTADGRGGLGASGGVGGMGARGKRPRENIMLKLYRFLHLVSLGE